MAADWSKIVLDPDAIAAGDLENIRAEFARFFLLHNPGPTLAVFTRRAKPSGCDVYFSPDCEAYAEFIFERHSRERTRAPSLLGTTLLVGYPESVSRLLGKAPGVAPLRGMLQRSSAEERTAGQTAFLRLKSTG
ncbi:MAG: hypothetical protein ABI547_05230 [Betaproteobacteria bacterium]